MSGEAESPATPPRDHFRKLVADWSHFGPPLRPSPEDTALVQAAIDEVLSAGARVGVLGLTPETIACRWPADTTLLALDHSPSMVAALWPPPPSPHGPAHAAAVVAGWLRMPLPDASLDLVCADGCHAQLAWPHGFDALTQEVHRVLKPGGHFVTRIFARTEQPEAMSTIADDLAAGHIASVHALKLRLLAALHGTDGGKGTLLDAVWRAWKQMPDVPAAQRGRPGWSVQEISGIDNYRDLPTRYWLPTRNELRSLHSALFDITQVCEAASGHTANCPTLRLVKARHGG